MDDLTTTLGRAPAHTTSTRLALALTLAVVFGGCDCGGGDGAADGGTCRTSADCAGGGACVDGRCRPAPDAGPDATAADLGGGGDEDGGAEAGACGPTCRPPALCRFGACIPDLGRCATNDDCPGDSYCSADRECIPYGVPPDVVNDPECRRRVVVGEVAPSVQCEWAGPAAGDPEPRSSLIYTAPLVADLNLDGDPARLQPSIVVTTWYQDASLSARVGMVRVFDGRTCEQQLHFGGPGDEGNRPGYGTQWAIADLDGDVPTGGRPELIGFRRTPGTGNAVPLELYAVRIDTSGPAPTATRLWYGRDCATGTTVRFSSNGANFGPAVFDLDDDGDPEILVGTMVFDHEGCLQNAFEDPVQGSHGPLYTVADVDLDGKVELVTGHRIAEWDPATTEWVDEPYFAPGMTRRPGHVAVVDLGQFSALPGAPTPNRLPEVVVVASARDEYDPMSTGSIRAETLDGRVIFGPMPLYSSPGVAGGHGGAPTASDFDGDGQAEFAAAANDHYTVYDPDCDADPDVPRPERPGGRCDRAPGAAALPMGILWAQPSLDFSSSSTGSSIFDFNGDGRGEAVYRDECYLRVYDGRDGAVLFSMPASSGTGYELPVIADVDGDFATEIVVARTNYIACPATDPLFAGGPMFSPSNGFLVLRDPEDRWASSRPIWNQHAYSVTHVTDDGRVVRTRDWRPNWIVPGLNNFRQNTQGDLGVLNIADLTVVFFDVAAICSATLPAGLPLRARVCNRGTNPVRDGVAVEFREGAALGCATVTTRLLRPGECEEVSCTATVTDADALIVVVDPADEIADCRPGNDEGVPPTRLCLI